MNGERVIGRGVAAALVTLVALALAGGSVAPELPGAETDRAYAAVDAPCGGEPMPKPDGVVSGSFSSAIRGSYVYVPFKVPARSGGKAVTAVRVKYCYDQPDVQPSSSIKNTLDLGLYGPRSNASRPWGLDEFRGWGGSHHSDVTVSSDGFLAADGATTRRFLPGPVKPGLWAVELGVASIVDQSEGNFDGAVDWRVEIDHLTGSEYADEPYGRTPCEEGGRCRYDRRPARARPGWYSGDFHVHSHFSGPDKAPLEEVFGYAFCPDRALGQICDQQESQPGAGLDFITLSDYVTGAQWGEIGRYQADYPGHLIIQSAEVVTYRGHANAHAYTRRVDYRTGPLYVLRREGELKQVRGPRPPSRFLRQISGSRGSGFTQINHPTIFPPVVPAVESLCRGCPWRYDATETDYGAVDAIEIATGPAGLKEDPEPGPNPFTPLAIEFWEDAIDAGGINANHIAAVGSSDADDAGGVDDPITQSPIGVATTVVRAPELSPSGIQYGVTAGHTYVKLWGADSPDVRLRAVAPSLKRGLGSPRRPAIIGDTVYAAGPVEFTARVFNLDRARGERPGVYSLLVFRNGALVDITAIPEGADAFTHRFSFPDGNARYRLQVMRDLTTIETVSSPIYVE